MTIYEALEDAGLVAAAVNITCYRGRHRYLPTVPGLSRAAYGPTRFFYYGLFESDRTGAPFAVRSRRAGSVDAYAAAVGRWLVTRDGFDFLAFYLSGFDFASHARRAGRRGRRACARAGRRRDRHAARRGRRRRTSSSSATRSSLLSDHGQTRVERAARLEEPLRRPRRRDRRHRVEPRRAGLSPARRAGRTRPSSRSGSTASPAVDVTLRREGDEVVARRDGADAPGREARPSRRRAARALGARESERGRAARLGGGGLGAHRPRRPPSRGRRQPRLARRRRLARAGRDASGSRRSSGGSRTSLRPCSSTSAWRRRRRWRLPRVSADERASMVERQLRRRGIEDERVLAAMERVPRELFVPPEVRWMAYADAALPIGAEQTISQPYMVALICEQLALHGDGARARRRHGLRLPGRRARRARRRGAQRSSGSRSSPRAHARISPRPATEIASSCTSATARAASRSARRSPRSRSRPPRSRHRPRSTSSSSRAAGSSSRSAGPTDNGSRSSCGRPKARPSCAPSPAASFRSWRVDRDDGWGRGQH